MVPAKYQTSIDSSKSYLMVGCFGGLGRSLAKYMRFRGAKHLTFLSRSGISKPLAKALVDELEQAGALVRVIVGDVTNFEDVQRAIRESSQPLGGIVQATMNLNVSEPT